VFLPLTEPIREEDITVLVLKLTDELARLSDPMCAQRVQHAQDFIRTHPHIKVFDPIESQRLTVDRMSLAKLFEYLDAQGSRISLTSHINNRSQFSRTLNPHTHAHTHTLNTRERDTHNKYRINAFRSHLWM
jgi:hypothetical protein